VFRIRSRLRARALAFHIFAVLSSLLSACSSDEPAAPRPNDVDECPAGQWAPDSDGVRAWRHDCEPYVSDHFTVYSDGSSNEAKAVLAGLAEQVFSELVGEFEIASDAELGFTPGYTYYIYAQRNISPAVAEGYRHGFLIAAIDSPERPNQRYPRLYRYLIKHELMHVFQFTLTGCAKNSEYPYWLDIWFSEGQAVVVGDYLPLPTLQEYRAWVSDPTHINPIRIHRRMDFPDPDRIDAYYRMFALSYAYLMDGTRGHGASISDVRDLFQYIKDGDSFSSAFERAFGVSPSYLEDSFYDIMEEYLGS
jgi:hypothetical protein